MHHKKKNLKKKKPTGLSDWHLSTHANIMCPFKAAIGGKLLHSCNLGICINSMKNPAEPHRLPTPGDSFPAVQSSFPLGSHHKPFLQGTSTTAKIAASHWLCTAARLLGLLKYEQQSPKIAA